jgi:hypothetical protein
MRALVQGLVVDWEDPTVLFASSPDWSKVDVPEVLMANVVATTHIFEDKKSIVQTSLGNKPETVKTVQVRSAKGLTVNRRKAHDELTLNPSATPLPPPPPSPYSPTPTSHSPSHSPTDHPMHSLPPAHAQSAF